MPGQRMDMFRRILLFCYILQTFEIARAVNNWSNDECLMGYMTTLQSWVTSDGALNYTTVDPRVTVDMSYITDPLPVLRHTLTTMKSSNQYVKYLSMAKCGLRRIPLAFHLKDSSGRYITDTVEYLTFYGNYFVTFEHNTQDYDFFFNATGAKIAPSDQRNPAMWSSSLEAAVFSRLKELDLRACSIQILNSNAFQGMRTLQVLYLGENDIFRIEHNAFLGLENLYHLDFSRNYPIDENGHAKNLAADAFYTFENLTKLVSLDLSHTRLTLSNLGMVTSLGKSLRSLSLCNTGLSNIRSGLFNKTSLEILDVSQNNGILSSTKSLQGLENSLVLLFAKNIGLHTINLLQNFTKLEVLQLSGNEISNLTLLTTRTLINLKILDLTKNRLPSWFHPIFSLMPKLRMLFLQENNINIISEQMIRDFENIEYLALSSNFIVCDCHVKDFYRMTAINELKFNNSKIEPPKKYLHHLAYDFYNNIIFHRLPVEYDFEGCKYEEIEETGRFRLIDYQQGVYTCFNFALGIYQLFSEVAGCNLSLRDQIDYDNELNVGKNMLLVLLLLPCLLLPALFVFVFRRNLRYCFITMRNSAMLSMINKSEVVEDNTIFNYDVFVSYCNEDRGWVLDHLLPHMEPDCGISVCLHERDFQVGLSILENIVSCMDRSRSIMLIISQRFLLSQWCQFEMHLAQHRLLETRREDLIIVLLEDIPRRLRPNTLHYLMLTKTYIVWPKENVSAERAIFWKRLKKSLISQKTKERDNVSLA